MSNLTNTTSAATEEITQTLMQTETSLSDLKKQADLLGINYPHNANVPKMISLIDSHMAKLKEEGNKREVNNITAKSSAVTLYNGKTLRELQDEAFKLIRIKLIVNNPSKINRDGQWITAGNSKVGVIKRYVPFKPEFYENGWHVEAIVLERLKQMKHQRFPKSKDAGNTAMDDYRKASLVNDFSIEILPPLTKEELEELARQQARTGSLKD